MSDAVGTHNSLLALGPQKDSDCPNLGKTSWSNGIHGYVVTYLLVCYLRNFNENEVRWSELFLTWFLSHWAKLFSTMLKPRESNENKGAIISRF